MFESRTISHSSASKTTEPKIEPVRVHLQQPMVTVDRQLEWLPRQRNHLQRNILVDHLVRCLLPAAAPSSPETPIRRLQEVPNPDGFITGKHSYNLRSVTSRAIGAKVAIAGNRH
uniref:(northern house mosquito) hypothetical protein n=1 Tax=Culex pipiens TaxID=7175 RepID=A0A8D8CHK6_CULPI